MQFLKYLIFQYIYEYIENENKYRLLYKIINNKEFISYCCIINHTYINNRVEHYELLKINRFTFNYQKLNSENHNNDKIDKNITNFHLNKDTNNNNIISLNIIKKEIFDIYNNIDINNKNNNFYKQKKIDNVINDNKNINLEKNFEKDTINSDKIIIDDFENERLKVC